jgi:hypothetical protein
MSARSALALAGASLTIAASVSLAASTLEGLDQGLDQGRSATPPATVSRVPAHAPGTAELEELTVKADAVIGIRLETAVAGERSRAEDVVTARITRDVRVSDRTAIPAGARLEGYVSVIAPGAGSKEPARIGLRFTTLVLDDGKTRVPINIAPIFRTAESADRTASRVGAGAIVGAILGAVVGGKRGAVIGGTAGAAGGAAAAIATAPGDIAIPAGTSLTVRLAEPFKVMVEKQLS